MQFWVCHGHGRKTHGAIGPPFFPANPESCSFHLLPPGQKKTLPSYYIPGEMEAPAQRTVSSRSRRKLTVAMWVSLGQPNVVAPLPGSNYAGMPARLRGLEHSKLDSNEYVFQLRKFYHKRLGRRAGSSSVPLHTQEWKLVHDRDPTHIAKKTAAAAAELGCKCVLLPPHGADLDPLDYGVFGAVKRRWREQYAEKQWDWDTAARKFIEMLQDADADPAIKALPGRMQACIEAKGWHFEFGYRKGHTSRKNARR